MHSSGEMVMDFSPSENVNSPLEPPFLTASFKATKSRERK